MREEISLGGFPYIQRLTARLGQAKINTDFDASLERLKTVVEADIIETE